MSTRGNVHQTRRVPVQFVCFHQTNALHVVISFHDSRVTAGRQRSDDRRLVLIVGRHAAVVKLGWLQLKGFIGWLFWSVAHIYFLIGLRNRFIVAFSWFWSYLTFQRGARLITNSPPKDEV